MIENDVAQVKFIGLDRCALVNTSQLLPFQQHFEKYCSQTSDEKFSFAVNEAQDLLEYFLNRTETSYPFLDVSGCFFADSLPSRFLFLPENITVETVAATQSSDERDFTSDIFSPVFHPQQATTLQQM